jgi:hypothetical protein
MEGQRQRTGSLSLLRGCGARGRLTAHRARCFYLLPLGPFSGLASLAKTELVVDPAAFAFLSCFGFFFSLLLRI